MENLDLKQLKEIITKALKDTFLLAINHQLVSPKKFQDLLINYQKKTNRFQVMEINYSQSFEKALEYKVSCKYDSIHFNAGFVINDSFNFLGESNEICVDVITGPKKVDEVSHFSDKISNKTKKINKGDAMVIVNRFLNKLELNSSNTNIANISISKPSWWLNIPPKRFTRDLHFILVKNNSFLWVKIPAPLYANPSEYFAIREDKNVVDIIISNEKGANYLKDIRSKYHNFDFKTFVLQEFKL